MQALQVFTNLKSIKPGADNWPVVVARLCGMVVTGSVGLRLLSSILRTNMTALLVKSFSGHTIVVGLGERARAFANDILSGKHGAIVVFDIKTSGSVADFCALNHIRCLEGDGLVPATLKLSNLQDAAQVIVATGSDERNLGIAKTIHDLVEETPREASLVLGVLIESPSLANMIAHDELLRESFNAVRINLYVFNPARSAAVGLLETAILAKVARQNRQPRIKLAMIGISDVAIEVLLQFLRTSPVPGLGKPLIELYVNDLSSAAARLVKRAPALLALLSPTDEEPGGPLVWAATLTLKTLEPLAIVPRDNAIATLPQEEITAIIIAHDDPLTNTIGALELRERCRRLETWNAPSLVFARKETSIDILLAGEPPSPDRRTVSIFGRISDLCRMSNLNSAREAKAIAIHEAYLTTKAADNAGAASHASERPWPELAEVYRQGNRRAVDHLAVKRHCFSEAALKGLPSISLPPEAVQNPGLLEKLASCEHDSWRLDRELDGWRRGERNDLRRLHPDLVCYEDLSDSVKEYDRAQIGFLAGIGQGARTFRP